MVRISNVWKKRITVLGHSAGRVALVILVASSSINGIALLWGFVFPLNQHQWRRWPAT